MSEKVLTSSGVSELWDAIKNRSISVKSVTLDEYGSMSEEEKKFDTLYIVSDDTPVTCYPISNPNLLDNWYFPDPINQRGETEYKKNGYTIDRWYFSRENDLTNAKVEIADGSIALTTDGNGYINFTQRLENYSQLVGEKCTVSALIDEELHSYTFTFGNGPSSGVTFVPDKVKFYSINTPSNHFLLRISAGQTITLKAVKLELGDHQTLARKEGDTWVLNDPPPNKALELAKCQRYQFGLKSSSSYLNIGFGLTHTNRTYVHVFVPLPVTLRSSPKIITTGRFILSEKSTATGSTGLNVTNITVSETDSNGVLLNAAADGLESGKVYRLIGKKDDSTDEGVSFIFDSNI